MKLWNFLFPIHHSEIEIDLHSGALLHNSKSQNIDLDFHKNEIIAGINSGRRFKVENDQGMHFRSR